MTITCPTCSGSGAVTKHGAPSQRTHCPKGHEYTAAADALGEALDALQAEHQRVHELEQSLAKASSDAHQCATDAWQMAEEQIANQYIHDGLAEATLGQLMADPSPKEGQ